MTRSNIDIPCRKHSKYTSRSRAGYIESLEGEQLEILASLCNKQLSSAVLIADTQGKIYWSNKFARSVADKWRLFKVSDNAEVTVTASSLRHLISLDFAETQGKPVKKYFSAGSMFFEVKKIFSPRKNSPHRLFAMEIDCYALAKTGEKSLANLSPAEYRLIQSLEKTRSLKGTAKVLNISYENARTKLKSIFTKLNVHSQSELLSKVHHVLDSVDFEQITAHLSHQSDNSN